MAHPIFTVGHSNRSIEQFLDVLRGADVDLVVDVRKLAGSRRNPQFGEDALAASLAELGIAYRREPALAGRRNVSHEVSPAVNALWRHRSFHNYADHALSDEFREGLARVRADAQEHRVALMCSEAVWWRCHRRLIADHLLAQGDEVLHIMSASRADAATLTPGAVVHADGVVTYPLPADSS